MTSIYKILTYILVPFAALFAVLTLLAFLLALGNPAMFLGVFMLAAVVIYVFCCLKFARRGIALQQPLKPGLKDWMKVNAYVSLPFGIMNFMQSFTLITKPALLQEVVTQMTEFQQNAGFPAQSTGMYQNLLTGMLYVVLVFSLVLLVHILMSFSLLKKYGFLFEASTSASGE